MKLSLIYETDLSRRQFLKLMGAGAMAASPLGQVVNLTPSAVKAVSIAKPAEHLLYIWTNTHFGRGTPPPLSDAINFVENAYQLLVDIVGHNKIISVGDEDYGFAVKMSGKQLKKAMSYLGAEDEEDLYKLNMGTEVIDSKGKTWLGYIDDTHANIIKDPVESWVSEYAHWDLPSFLYSSEDIKELETRNLERYVEPEDRSKLEDAKSNVEDREWHEKKRDSDRLTKPSYVRQEFGYKKKSHFDPQSSRYVQELGPFEEKLNRLLSLIE